MYGLFHAVAWHGLHKTVPLYLPIVCTLYSIHIYIYIYICACLVSVVHLSRAPRIFVVALYPNEISPGNYNRIQFGKEVYTMRLLFSRKLVLWREWNCHNSEWGERDFSVFTFLATSSNPSFNREPRSSFAVSYFAINIWYTSIYIMYIYIYL
jgi:hypothetical protein